MLRQNLWKILLSLALIGWAVVELIPLQDRPFDQYLQSQVRAKSTEFAALMREAQGREAALNVQSVFVPLKQVAAERKIDLSEFFPQIRLESSLKNVEKRNSLLMDELLRRSKGRVQLGLDLHGGVAFTLEVAPRSLAGVSASQRQEKLTKAIDIISSRINSLGVAEPIVRPEGDNRIQVQLPGISTRDNPEIVSSLKKPARLDFRLVYREGTPDTMPPDQAPPGYEAMTLEQEDQRGQIRTEDLYVKRIPEMAGSALSEAYASMDEFGRFKILLRFTKEGGQRFAAVTRGIAEENRRSGGLGRLAIVLDGKLYSAPTVREEIPSGSAEISGSFTQREAMELASVLNNPLDLPLDIKEQYEVGPSLAQDAVTSGVRASIIATALVAAFMITFYSVGGLVAVAVLAVNILIIFGVLASVGATMTLPGLAGIVLTIGMAVDANILIFERMREELALGKTLATSNQSGFLKALWTILDAHAVQLIICAIMIWRGTGPIKGFGVTLAIGVLSTLFSVLITGHLVMELLTVSGWLKRFTMRRMLKDLRVDFVRYGKPSAIASVSLVIVSFAYVLYQGEHIYGIDFVGGDVISLEFNQKLDTAKVRQSARAAGIEEINPSYASPIGGGRETLNIETPEGRGAALLAQLQKDYPNEGWKQVGENHIGASIGKEIQWNALVAIGLSMLTILFYIAFRFEIGFGIGAMASILHDILMNIGIFVLSGHQFSAPMVAAILCVAGYSINETVIVFDRIREELKINPSGTLKEVINTAIRKVFARTIMTATTTFLAALALFLFGSGVLKDISFTFLVGIATSTFSAIFIAAQVFYWWHKGDRKHVEAHADIAPKYEWTGTSRASQ